MIDFETRKVQTKKKKQKNKIKVNIFKVIPECLNAVSVVSTFSFAHYSNIYFLDLYHYFIQ
jgi:hypothetical protein